MEGKWKRSPNLCLQILDCILMNNSTLGELCLAMINRGNNETLKSFDISFYIFFKSEQSIDRVFAVPDFALREVSVRTKLAVGHLNWHFNVRIYKYIKLIFKEPQDIFSFASFS